MFLYNNFDEEFRWQNTSIALGNFDGIHKGHKAVIENTHNCRSLIPCLFTFCEPPVSVLGGKTASQISTESLKLIACENLGIQVYININFRDIMNLTPEEFVLLLKDKFNAKILSCGFNFRFGKDRAGNAQMLKALGVKAGIQVIITPPVLDGDEPISSSRIRKALMEGDIRKANNLMGRNFAFDFEVISGDQRGRLLGAPTINQQWPEGFIKIKYGVYASKVKIKDKLHNSVTNIGVRPTIGEKQVTAETYIINFDGNLYGQKIYVELIDFIRQEKKFSSVDELKKAIMIDAEKAKKILK